IPLPCWVLQNLPCTCALLAFRRYSLLVPLVQLRGEISSPSEQVSRTGSTERRTPILARFLLMASQGPAPPLPRAEQLPSLRSPISHAAAPKSTDLIARARLTSTPPFSCSPP